MFVNPVFISCCLLSVQLTVTSAMGIRQYYNAYGDPMEQAASLYNPGTFHVCHIELRTVTATGFPIRYHRRELTGFILHNYCVPIAPRGLAAKKKETKTKQNKKG
jgi:hypothetical protein